MSTLEQRLQRLKASFEEQAPESALAAIAQSTQELRDSDLLANVPQIGSTLPDFELPDHDGNAIRSAELIKRGPLVISFYRGVW